MIKFNHVWTAEDIADCKVIVIQCGEHVGVFRKQASGDWRRDSLPYNKPIGTWEMVVMLNHADTTLCKFSVYPDDFAGEDTYKV